MYLAQIVAKGYVLQICSFRVDVYFGNYILDKTNDQAYTETLPELLRRKGNLISLWDMVELMEPINIKSVLDTFKAISYWDGVVDGWSEVTGSKSTDFDFQEMLKVCHQFGLIETQNRIISYLTPKPIEPPTPENAVKKNKLTQLVFNGIRDSFKIESARLIFFCMDVNNANYWYKPTDGWSEVLNAITHPDIEDQISEASRCFAMERYAACVFHLNCVIDLGLLHIKSRVKKIAIDTTKKPTWGTWITAINSYCNQKPAPPEAPKLIEINAVLSAIKTPWRDAPTHSIHMVRIREEARVQYDGIQRVMKMIADL